MLTEMHELKALGGSIWWRVERGLGAGCEEDEELRSGRDLKQVCSFWIRDGFEMSHKHTARWPMCHLLQAI